MKMAHLAIYLLTVLDVVLMIRGQRTFPPIIPTFPPPPTMNTVVNETRILFVKEPISVGVGDRVIIDCKLLIDEAISKGVQNPTVKWFKDGDEITNKSIPNVKIVADNRVCLVDYSLLQVGGQIDNTLYSNYTCEVDNYPSTHPDINCDLSDIAPPTNDPMVSLESVSLTCGQEVFVENLTGVSLNIQCKFLYNGSEPLTYEVYKNGVVYKGGVLSKKVFSLTIFPASNDDYGEYTFVALTEFCGLTFVMSRVIAVMYADPPHIDYGGMKVQSVEKGIIRVKIGTPVYITDESIVIIDCNAKGIPPITHIWFHNNKLDWLRGDVSSITITVTNAADVHGDIYTCRAENRIGFDVMNTTIYYVKKEFCIIP